MKEKRQGKRSKTAMLISLLLVLAMALTACGNSNSTTTSTSSESAENTGTEAKETDAGNGEAFKITMMQELYSDAAPDYANNAWFAYLQEELNVELSINFVPTSTYVDKITTYIASNTLPMVFTARSDVLQNNNLIMSMESDGFWTLDDYLADYPNLYEFVGAQTWENSKINGKNYGIPRLRILARNGAIIRQDWLDNLELDMPETFDELYEVLRAFTEDDPDGNGVDDTYGLTTAYEVAANRSWNGIQTLAVAFGAPNGWVYADGEMVPDYGTEEYLTALQYLRKIYENGYMNLDFGEITANTRYEYFQQGSYGMVFGVIDDANNQQENLVQVVPDAQCAVLAALHKEGEDPLCNATAGFNGLLMFTKFGSNAIETEDDLRKILSFYDSLCKEDMQDFIGYGIEGVHHEVIDGVKTLFYNDQGKTVLSVDVGDFSQLLPIAAFTRRPTDTALITSVFDAADEREAYLVNDVSTNLKSDTKNELSSELDTIMMDASVKFIVGTIDEAGYLNEYAKWLAQGGEDVIKEFKAYYEEYIQ